MEAKFSPRVKDIISLSRTIALGMECDYIGIEHLILGIIRDKDNEAFQALVYLGINIEEFEKILIHDSKPVTPAPNKTGSIPLTKAAEKILKITYLEVKISKENYISSFHLLLSCLRDEDSIPSKLLEKYGIDYEVVRPKYSEIINSIIRETDTPKEKPKEKPSYQTKIVSKSNNPTQTVDSKPLSLIFDTSEYSTEDIKGILQLLSEMYSNIGGDFLKISGMSQFERIVDLDLA